MDTRVWDNGHVECMITNITAKAQCWFPRDFMVFESWSVATEAGLKLASYFIYNKPEEINHHCSDYPELSHIDR